MALFCCLRSKFSCKLKALDHDKISDFCLMKIKPQRHIIYQVVYPTQFFSSDRHGNEEHRSVSSRSHSYILKGRI